MLRTKPALARRMIGRQIDSGTPFRWVAGDEVYGQGPELRHYGERAGLGYVLAVASNHRIDTPAGRVNVDALTRTVRASAWHTYSAGDGAKGRRLYDWAWIDTRTDQPDGGGHRWVMIRRHRSTGELAYYRYYAVNPVSLATLTKVAGRGWPIETDFQTSKGQTGLDEHQVRLWIS